MAVTKWINTNGGDWHTAANWDNGVPTQSNQAVIDAASFAANGKSITLSALAECAGLDVSGADQTFTISSSVYELHLYGNYVGSTNCTFAMTLTAFIVCKATLSITTNGQTIQANRLITNGTGITVTQVDALNIGTSSLYLINGTFDQNGQTFTGTGSFVTATGTKTLKQGAGTFNIGTWNNAVPTGFTFTPDTGTVNITATSTLTGANTFYNLTFTGAAAITAAVSLASNIAFTNLFTVTGSTAERFRVLVQSSAIGTARTITGPAVGFTATNADFQDITIVNAKDLSAVPSIGDCGGNSGITFPAAVTAYRVPAGNVSDATGWRTESGGAVQSRVPLPQDSAVWDANSGTGTHAMDCPRIGSISMVDAPVMTWALSNAMSCYGHYVLGENVTPSGSYALTLAGRGSYNLDLYNSTVYAIYVNTFGGFYTALSNITNTSTSQSFYFTILNGTFDLNDFNLSTWRFTPSVGTFFYMGNGIIELLAIGTGIQHRFLGTIYAEGSTILLNPASGSGDVTIDFNSKSFNIVRFSGAHTGNFIVSGNNTFADLQIDAGRKVQLAASSTQTIAPAGKLTAIGTPDNKITLSAVSGTAAIAYAGTGYHQLNDVEITAINVTANRFYAGRRSTVNSGTGWKTQYSKAPQTIQIG